MRVIVALTVLLGIVVCCGAMEPDEELTLIVEPLHEDGTVNYFAALDRLMAEGVTAENNAAPFLLRTFGREWLHVEVSLGPHPWTETLRRLDLEESDVTSSTHFVQWEDRQDNSGWADLRLDDDDPCNTCPADHRPDLPRRQSGWQDPGPELLEANPGLQAELEALVPGIFDGEYVCQRCSHSGPSVVEVFQLLREGHVHPDAREWLKQNAEPLEHIYQATRRPRLYLPPVSSDDPPTVIGIWLPNLRMFSQAAIALSLRSVLRAQEGDMSGAWADVLTIHRLARLVDQNPQMMWQMVACNLEATAAVAAQRLATQYRDEPGRLREMLEALQKLRDVADLERIARMEHFLVLDTVMVFHRGQRSEAVGAELGRAFYPDPPQNIDWVAVARQVNRNWSVVHETSRLAAQGDFQEAQRIQEAEWRRAIDYRLRWRLLTGRGTRSRLVADLLTDFTATPMTTAGRRQWVANAHRQVAITTVALAAYRAQHDRWPATLEDLSPEYLPDVPRDIFTGGPLIYRIEGEGYLVYSRGPSRVDHGGRRTMDSGQPGDPDDIPARSTGEAWRPR